MVGNQRARQAKRFKDRRANHDALIPELSVPENHTSILMAEDMEGSYLTIDSWLKSTRTLAFVKKLRIRVEARSMGGLGHLWRQDRCRRIMESVLALKLGRPRCRCRLSKNTSTVQLPEAAYTVRRNCYSRGTAYQGLAAVRDHRQTTDAPLTRAGASTRLLCLESCELAFGTAHCIGRSELFLPALKAELYWLSRLVCERHERPRSVPIVSCKFVYVLQISMTVQHIFPKKAICTCGLDAHRQLTYDAAHVCLY